MNIQQISDFARKVFELGKLAEQSAPQARTVRHQQFAQELENLADVKTLDWFEAQRISDIDEVDEVFRAFADDATADNATCLVQVIVKAYLKG